MGLFDSIVGQVESALAGNQAQNGQGNLMEAVTHLITNPETGGLQGLVQAFQNQGLGEIVASWIGNGQNMAITAAQIEQVIGTERLQFIAQKFGVAPDTIASGLAQMLPQVIDRLSPNGQLPAGHLVEQGLAMLKGKLFG